MKPIAWTQYQCHVAPSLRSSFPGNVMPQSGDLEPPCCSHLLSEQISARRFTLVDSGLSLVNGRVRVLLRRSFAASTIFDCMEVYFSPWRLNLDCTERSTNPGGTQAQLQGVANPLLFFLSFLFEGSFCGVQAPHVTFSAYLFASSLSFSDSMRHMFLYIVLRQACRPATHGYVSPKGRRLKGPPIFRDAHS